MCILGVSFPVRAAMLMVIVCSCSTVLMMTGSTTATTVELLHQVMVANR